MIQTNHPHSDKPTLRHLVFWPSAALFYFFLLLFFIYPNHVLDNLKWAQSIILTYCGGLYQISVATVVFIVGYLYLSPLRNQKIGGTKAIPLLKKYEWFYITLCTVIAAALLFWACAEPLFHKQQLSTVLVQKFQHKSPSAAVIAIMLFHWTFVPYCIYAIPSISLALTIKHPSQGISFSDVWLLISKKPLHKNFTSFVDSICLFTLTSGMSASLAVGVLMLSSALHHLIGIAESPLLYAMIIVFIVVSFVSSATSGLLKGIRTLSFFNTNAFYLIGLFVLFAGPTNFIVYQGLEGFWVYISHFLNFTLFPASLFPSSWLNDWTLLHWGSWLAWAPMTGLFLAKLSYGYTVKDIVKVQVLLPGFFTCLWITIFSGATLYYNQHHSVQLFALLENKGPQTILFQVFSYLPGVTITSVILTFLIALSFITAADSNTEAISSLCLTLDHHKKKTNATKLFWGLSIGSVSWILVSYTGIEGLRLLNYIGGLPALGIILSFSFILLTLSFKKKPRKS